MNQKKIENKFYAAAPGKKTTMARNSEFDTDEVKNLVHKESRDAEWGIDRESKGRGLYTYSAYHAYIGEPVFTKRFNTRGEAEKWLEKQNAASHPNKRKSARPGAKEMFGSADKVDNLMATAYRALRDGDKAAARKLIARAEALIQSDSSVPDYIVNELNDLKKSLRFSRRGTKSKFANEWNTYDDREADRLIKRMQELEQKCSKKRSEIFDVETKMIPRIIAATTAAKKNKDVAMLASAMHMSHQADDVRYSFSRPGAKAKFAWQPEISGRIRKVNASIDQAVQRLRDATKTGRWNLAAGICRNLGSMYSGMGGGLAGMYDELQIASDKEWRSK